MISIDFTKLTRLERDALTFAANPEGAAVVTAEEHLRANVEAFVNTALELYIHNKLPGLRLLAIQFLGTDDARQKEIRRLLDEGNAEPPAEDEDDGEPPTEPPAPTPES